MVRKLTSVTLPSTIQSIGFFAFRNCISLSVVTIPDSVRSIGFPLGSAYPNRDPYENSAFIGCLSLRLESQAALRRRGYKDTFDISPDG